MGDDPDREYAYTIYAPYDSLQTLVAFFEKSPGQGTLTDRLVGCFAALIEQGQLDGELPLREIHLRVARWFEQAGVPTETWAWINSG